MRQPTSRQPAAGALELDDVAPYLLARGLLQPSSIVDGGLTVADCSRRNRVFLVTAPVGRCFVLKLDRPGEDPAVAREAAVLARLAARAANGRLARHLPVVVAYEEGVLVMETSRSARDLSRHHGVHARGRLSRALARDAGAMLGRLHALPSDTLAGLSRGDGRAWGLRVHRPDLAAMNAMSAGALELVRRIQSSAELCDALDALAATPGDQRPIHGDVRWDNCLAIGAGRSERYRRVVLIDWELALDGDPCIDAGAFLGEYLLAWVRSIPIVDRREPGRLLAHARMPLRLAQPAMRAFWDGYTGVRGRPELDVARVTSFAAVRLLEAAFEGAARQATPRPRLLNELQLAMNVLLAPRRAARRLLGLEAAGP